MKPLTTSIYTFSELIRGGYKYVDKTAGIYRLVRGYKGLYFLSRPRRFGKSLLISTLKSIFLGQRELFDGLAITETDYDWETYPVIHLDFGSVGGRSVEEIEAGLLRKVRQSAAANECQLEANNCYDAFDDLIRELADGDRSVVTLIDEYDKPLLGHLGSDSAQAVQRVLKQFYSVIKTTEPYQRFVLLTGVSKFSQVSVFSDLNNLTDLTMYRETATLLGYTQAELESNFAGYIERLAAEEGNSVEDTLRNLHDWYDGYRFEDSAERVYNPVSVMKCFIEGKFKNYWFETGTPTFLMDVLKRTQVDMEDLSLPETAFSSYDPADLHPLPLLLQTGYLTIKGTRDVMGMRYYELDYPNREIQQSFSYWLARALAELPDPELSRTLQLLAGALQDGRVDDMFEHLKIFFSGIPNTITLDHEKYYQTIFFTVFKFIGATIETEISTNRGRIDAVIKTDSHIFIFEFKLHGTAQEAMDQIHQTEYAAPYLDDPRPVTLIGAAFDPETRNIGQWITESVAER